MNEAEKKEYEKRRKAKIQTLLTIKKSIDGIHDELNMKVTKKNEVKIIVNTLFEMFANLCAIYDLDLEDSIKATIAESGSDVITEYFESISHESSNTDEPDDEDDEENTSEEEFDKTKEDVINKLTEAIIAAKLLSLLKGDDEDEGK